MSLTLQKIPNVSAHHVFDSREDLGEDELAGVVCALPLVADLVVEVASSCVLQHQVEAAGRLHHLVESHHVGVLQEVHAADLLVEQTLGLSVQLGLIQDLQGHFVYEMKMRIRTSYFHVLVWDRITGKSNVIVVLPLARAWNAILTLEKVPQPISPRTL